MILITLIAALAAVLIVAAWRIPGAVVTMHKNALDHRHRTMQLQDETDEHAHRRYLEMDDRQRNVSGAELAVRTAEAAAEQAAAEARTAEARVSEIEIRARHRR